VFDLILGKQFFKLFSDLDVFNLNAFILPLKLALVVLQLLDQSFFFLKLLS
jgi:hypothetical protein